MRTYIQASKFTGIIRSFYFLLLLLLAISENIQAQEWYLSQTPHGRTVTSLHIIDTSNIVVVGSNEANGALVEIFKTRDGGISWDIIPHTGEMWFKSVAFSGPYNGISVGYKGNINKTVNGGNSFDSVGSPIDRDFHKVTYANSNTVYITGGRKNETDTLQTVLKSVDGGDHWSVVLDRYGQWLRSAAFTDSLHGIAVGDEGTILRTIDGGVSWNTIPSPVTKNLYSVTFLNSTTGFIAGGRIFNDTSTILKTTNGGATWVVVRDSSGGMLTDLTFVRGNPTVGYAVGLNATLLKTVNGGTTWTKEEVNNVIPGVQFNAVEFYNNDFGMIGSQDGYNYIYSYQPQPEVYTSGYKSNSDTSVTLRANINTHGKYAIYTFGYSLDSLSFFYHVDPTLYWTGLKSNTFHPVEYGIDHLIEDTTYYYFIIAKTLSGPAYGDTLSFYTKFPGYSYDTYPTVVELGQDSVKVKGYIKKFPFPVNLSFEYGTSPLFDSEIIADPPAVNDTLEHEITAILTSLQPRKLYYFRLKITTGNNTYYGGTQAFFKGEVFTDFQTLPATDIRDSSAVLNAVLNNSLLPMTLGFEYGETPALGKQVAAVPENANDTITYQLSAQLKNLEPETKYYYRVKGTTAYSTYNQDIESFTTDKAKFIFKTGPAEIIGNDSVRLTGNIGRLPEPVSLTFEYDTSEVLLAHESPAIPSSINDTLLHQVSLNIGSLIPYKAYYYRLKGTTGTGNLYGRTRVFFTGGVYETFEALPATNITTEAATLNGTLDKARLPFTFSFLYGTTPSLNNEILPQPLSVNDTSEYSISAGINNLIPGTTYYYCLLGKTALGDYFSDTLSFTTGIQYTNFRTLPVSELTDHTAQLNGDASGFPLPVTLSFEYGTTKALGNSVTPEPAGISDTLHHHIKVKLTGLQTDQVYYYCLKATRGALTISGDTLQFYPGEPEIPNWDFQFWREDTASIPKYWSTIGGYQPVAGHGGNYAIKLSGPTLLLNGILADDIFGGEPLNVSSQPDSIVAFLNYSVEPGDTAVMILLLKKDGHFFDTTYCMIQGGSAGVFERLAFKIHYTALEIPDSLVLIFSSTNFLNKGSQHYNNEMIVDDISFQPGNIGFVNSDFEDWFQAVIHTPQNWVAYNFIGLDPDNTEKQMISKVYFEAPDDYAVAISNVSFFGQNAVISGSLKGYNDTPYGEFPVRGKHLTLNGYYKYFPAGEDSLDIRVSMNKGGVVIGSGQFHDQSDTVPDFTPFSIPIYYDLPGIPDSASIDIRCTSSFNPSLGTTLIVDKLSFDGFVLNGFPTKIPEIFEAEGMKVYPNPARDHIIIENLIPENIECSLVLIRMNGQVVRELKFNGDQKQALLETGDLPPGTYILVLRKGNKTFNKKVVIQ